MKSLKKVIAMVVVLSLMMTAVPIKGAEAKGKITGVKQVDASTSSISVSCDANLTSGGYALEISTDKESWVVKDVDKNPNNLKAEDLSAGKSYYARVVGYSSDCFDYYGYWNGGETVAVDASEPIEVVTEPDNVSLSVLQIGATTSGFSLKCSANKESGANFFRVYDVYTDKCLGEGAAGTVSVKNLSAGSGYGVYIYACRVSETGFVATGSGEYVQKRFKTVAESESKGGFGITESWVNIDTFKFSVSDVACDGHQLQFLTVNGKVAMNYYFSGDYCMVKDFVKGTFYRYRVRSYVKCDNNKTVYSKWSGCKTVAIPKKATWRRSGKYMEVDWSKVNGASGYTVYVSDKENSGYKKVKSVGVKNRSVTIKKISGKKVKRGKYYSVRIVPRAKFNGKTVNAEWCIYKWDRFY